MALSRAAPPDRDHIVYHSDPLKNATILLAAQRTRRVTFLADRGFRDRAWARTCTTLGWDYIIRIANNTTITLPGGVVATAETLGMKQGERRYLPNVRVTLEADWTCSLAITWTRATPSCPSELCVVWLHGMKCEQGHENAHNELRISRRRRAAPESAKKARISRAEGGRAACACWATRWSDSMPPENHRSYELIRRLIAQAVGLERRVGQLAALCVSP